MTDKNNVSDFLNRIGGRRDAPPAAPAAPALVSSKEEYRAAVPFLSGQEREYVTAFMSNGDERDVKYAFHIESISVAPDEGQAPDRLMWIYTNGVLFIRGPNVRALRPMLKERQISELHPFDPARHKDPEPGEVVILELVWRYPDEVRNGNT